MKKITLLFACLIIGYSSNAQFVAIVQMDEKVKGICDHDKVYSLFNYFEGQEEAKCAVAKEKMLIILNEKLSFLKENPKFKSKGQVHCFINCEGKVLNWYVSNKSKSEEFNKKIIEIFKTFNDWEVGTLNGKAVDSSETFFIDLKKEYLYLNNMINS